jgi:UDP-glucose 4-epimerase
MAILVTGGAGYIGSATVELLREAGETVIVIDNLSRGHREAVNESVPFYEGDIGDSSFVSRICRENRVTACVHFAAYAYVGESVENPGLYYRNNVSHTMGLLDGLRDGGADQIVFSSTCATYGEPVRVPLDEEHPQSPASPYGWSKFMVERILEDYEVAYGLRHVALRYFNASGAYGRLGEDHQPESHLIPLVLQVALDQRNDIAVFGSDYPTPDGTAIRDYIHIADLGQAHIQALKYLNDSGASTKINLGNGSGYSVLEVIETARRITGHEIPARMEPRRAGDPSRLIAVADKAKDLLGWNPQYPELEEIIQSAWDWHQAHPKGYKHGLFS